MKTSLHSIVRGAIMPKLQPLRNYLRLAGAGTLYYNHNYEHFSSAAVYQKSVESPFSETDEVKELTSKKHVSNNVELTARQPKVGEVWYNDVDKASDKLFVPGSISNPMIVGVNFAQKWRDKTGEEIAVINSNMPITDYPSQYFQTQAATERNKKVEMGIVSFIKDNPCDSVKIMAHSAGCKSALEAVRSYKESGGTKNVELVLMGPGSPSPGMNKALKAVVGHGVAVAQFVDKLDLIPSVSGRLEECGQETIYVNTQTSSVETEGSDKLLLDVESLQSISREKFKAILEKRVQAHYVGNYFDAVLEQHKQEERIVKFGVSKSLEGAGIEGVLFNNVERASSVPISYQGKKSSMSPHGF